MELERNKRTRKILQNLLILEDRVMGVPFPKMRRVKQISAYHCGPAVVSELLSFLGKNVSQTSVVKSLRAKNKIKKLGLNVNDLARAANTLGHHEVVFWKKRGSTVNDLSLAVNKYKYPVGVEWQGVFYENEDGDNGHYSVITKIDKKADYLRICDSYAAFSGVDRRFRIKRFTKRWWDINKVRGRNIVDRKVIFVITPKNETWPRRLGMKRV
jgi:hypothetical protein